MLDATGRNMKLHLIVALLWLSSPMLFSQERQHVSTSEQFKTKVLKVISIVDDDFEFVSYEIEFNKVRIMVSEPITFNKYKIGDEIEVMIVKMTNKNPYDGKPLKTMTFSMMPSTLFNQGAQPTDPFAPAK
jgi:hypothetical protein